MDLRTLPDIELPSGDGTARCLLDLLQQRDGLIAVLHGPDCESCAALLQALDHAGTGRLRGALAVAFIDAGGRSSPPWERGTLRVRDGDGHLLRALRKAANVPAGEASLLVSDRFGVLYASLPIHGAVPEAALNAAAGWLDFIEVQCPECGVPEW